MELITAFYVGAACTAAFALCVITWLRAKHENALSDAFDEGLNTGLAQNVTIVNAGSSRSNVVEGRVPPTFIDETLN